MSTKGGTNPGRRVDMLPDSRLDLPPDMFPGRAVGIEQGLAQNMRMATMLSIAEGSDTDKARLGKFFLL